MRSEKEVMALIETFIQKDERIRVATLEGSRTNPNAIKDVFQDYDVSFFVTDLDSYEKDDRWLSAFGNVVFLQKPERMTLFPPDFPGWLSYVTYFNDGVRIDITLIPLHEIQQYVADCDGLMRVLIDKDGWMTEKIVATDEQYWIQKPTPEMLKDSCNEFWHVASYVVKGIYRDDYFFAVDHFNEVLRQELLRLISWSIGFKYGFNFSLGKHYKHIKQYITDEEYEALLQTLAMHHMEALIVSYEKCCELFERYTKIIAHHLNMPHPTDGARMCKFLSEYAKQRN